MAQADLEQGSSLCGCSLPSKWAFYRVLCYLLHIILVLAHIVLLLLYKYRTKENVNGLTGSGDIASVGIVIGLLAFSILYGYILVWLTQQLAFRSTLAHERTLTEIHDKCTAWLGIISAIAVLSNDEVAKSVWLILLYLLGIAGLHVTSSSLMSITLFVPNSADGSLQYQLTINVTPVRLPLDPG
ncbi:hypothetical protein EDC04DRAFT_1225436 [Pisolithus marmoratus]|nr:hypothetical protein EDC04DRAFT_1225436 [Pisolithus marmoratus]